MNFKAVIEKYVYPVISKDQATAISRYRNTSDPQQKHYRLHGFPNGTAGKISDCWRYLIDAPFKISESCCDVMKKRPIEKYNTTTGRRPYLGTMVEESNVRLRRYMAVGCNGFDLKKPVSTPIAFWQEGDVWQYLRQFKVPYSIIYDMGEPRTGCMFCAFGAHLDGTPNRFQRMAETHPKQWAYCMDKLGMREVLEFIGVNPDPPKYIWDEVSNTGKEDK